MISVQFEGGKELVAALGTLSKAMSKKILIESLKDAAEPMRARMARLAPKGDPQGVNLSQSMEVMTSRGQDALEAAVAVGPTKEAFYGSFQEFGTAHHAAQPFARPAFDSEKEKALQLLAAALWRELAARGVNRGTVLGGPVNDSGGGSGSSGLGEGTFQPTPRGRRR